MMTNGAPAHPDSATDPAALCPVVVRDPADDQAGRFLAEQIGWTLGMTQRALHRAYEEAADSVPAGFRGYQVLSMAALGSARTQLELAQRLGIDRTVMTYLLDDLERAGLLTRRPDPDDRRARQVVVTASGHDVLAALAERVLQAEQHVLAPLPLADAELLRTSLRTLAEHCARIDPVPFTCASIEQQLRDGPTG